MKSQGLLKIQEFKLPLYTKYFLTVNLNNTESTGEIKALYGDLIEFVRGHQIMPVAEKVDILRTWIYLKDIHRTYSDFNTARREFFQENKIEFSEGANELPASTCIGGRSSGQSGIIMNLICVDKKLAPGKIRRLFNKYQNEAEGSQYLSKPAFSRALLIEAEGLTELQVSGTASINESGDTVYLNDPYLQIKKTLINVAALLEQAGMDFSDFTESSCFFKKRQYYNDFLAVLNYVSPPLIELWRTAPYLHDGSAPTLRDVLTTKNAGNRHGVTSQLTSTQIDQLVAYLLQVKSGNGDPTPTSGPTPTPTRAVTPTPSRSVTPTPPATPSPTSGAISAFSQIEAESFNSQSGIQNKACAEGGQNIGYIENGDYAVYNNVDFAGGATGFQARVASNTSGGNIEIRLDSATGALVGTCTAAGTGGRQTWVTATCNVSGASGIHNLYLIFTGGGGYLFNLNWFRFTSGTVTPTPAATPSPTARTTPTPTRANTPTPTPANAYVRFRNAATGLYIDGMGSTANGSNACQYSSSSSYSQQWAIINSGGYILIQNRATGLYLDGMGRASNGSVCGQWAFSGSTNQQWTQETVGSNVRLKIALPDCNWTEWARPPTAPTYANGVTAAVPTSSGRYSNVI